MKNKYAGFAVDTTLGRLAKWLRIMGIDAHYQHSYKKIEIETLIKKGRVFLTRNKNLNDDLEPSFLIHSDKVQDQLIELKESGFLPETSKNWFKRCIRCNIPLQSAQIEDAQGRIPEYIISQNIEGLQHCPSCNRYFWPGSHRGRMLKQIHDWGIRDEKIIPPPGLNDSSRFDTETETCD